jgi:Flp pilus assembly protein TadD
MVPQEDGVRLMAAAWRTHPSDYVLAYRCSNRLWGMQDRIGEMLAWAKVAVALRPDSPFAHNQLGITWRAMHEWVEAEASARRAIELGKKYPKYAGAHAGLGNIMLAKGDLDGAEANYRTAIAIDPDSPCYLNMGLVYDRRGDLAGAEQWHRKAVAAAPKNAWFRQVLDGVVRKRALLVRLDEVTAGRAKPATPAEAIDFAEVISQPPRRRYLLALSFYLGAFAAEPSMADDLGVERRYNAACIAALAAAGQDAEMTARGVEEWGYLTARALKWMRANIAYWTSQAKDPKRWQQVRDKLTHWKNDADLASVRDPAWLAAMPERPDLLPPSDGTFQPHQDGG